MTPEERQMEFAQAKSLAGHLGLDPAAVVNNSASFPDALIRLPLETIGIEVTRLHREGSIDGRPVIALESEQEKTISIAMEKYTEAGGSPVCVAVYFNSEVLYSKNRHVVAEWLVELVRSNCPDPGGQYEWDSRSIEGYDYPTCLISVSAFRSRSMAKSHWHQPKAAWSSSGLAEALDIAIVSKQGKISEYLSHCDKCYLLLVSDWTISSMCFEIPDDFKYAPPVNDFEDVYFLSSYGREIKKLGG